MYDPFEHHPVLKTLSLDDDQSQWPRVRVTLKSGGQKWRQINDIHPDDTIDLRSSGQPFQMKGTPGRRKKVEIKPKNPEVAEILRRKSTHISKDPLSRMIKKNPDDTDILHVLMAALAEETASLRFDRSEAERSGADPDLSSSISTRRLKALKDVGDMWFKRLDLQQNNLIDMESPAFQALFGILVETFELSMTELLVSPDTQDAIIRKLSGRLSDESWVANAKFRMKEAVEAS